MVSFAILSHNEGEYLDDLIGQLCKVKNKEDEIVIVDDFSDHAFTKIILNENEHAKRISLYRRHLDKDFAAQKNFLNSKCKGDWIVNIDADESLSPLLAEQLHDLIELNKNTDVIWVPRINIVNGISDEHLNKWGWRIDKEGHVNFPDWQLRMYKNKPEIYWVGKVHEVLNGYKNYSFLPAEKEYCLIHIKTIDRQDSQNRFYGGI